MADNAVCVWDVNDPTRTTSPQLVLRGHKGEVRALAALADGRLASAGDDKFIIIWNLADGAQLAKLEGHTDWVRCLAAVNDDGDGRGLASGSDDKSIIIYDHERRRAERLQVRAAVAADALRQIQIQSVRFVAARRLRPAQG